MWPSRLTGWSTSAPQICESPCPLFHGFPLPILISLCAYMAARVAECHGKRTIVAHLSIAWHFTQDVCPRDIDRPKILWFAHHLIARMLGQNR